MEITLKKPTIVPEIIYDKKCVKSLSINSGAPGETPSIRILSCLVCSQTGKEGPWFATSPQGDVALELGSKILALLEEVIQDEAVI